MSQLKINLLGETEIKYMGEDIIDKLSTKSVAIIAILICQSTKKIPREKIASMLWADSFDTANYNLRYNLWNIRKIIPLNEEGEEFIISTKEYCMINPKYQFDSDLIQAGNYMEKSVGELDTDSLFKIKELLKNEFLEHLYIKDADDFNDWILFKRTNHQKFYQSCLNRAFVCLNEIMDYSGAVDILEEMLQCNPYDEEAHYKLMETFMKKGERHLAVMQYKKCDALIREELNLSPQMKIKNLYLSIIENQEEKLEQLQKEGGSKYLKIKIDEDLVKGIDYFTISLLVEKILHAVSKPLLNQIPKRYLRDISLIQPLILEILGEENSGGYIKDVRLFISMGEFMAKVSAGYTIEVNIKKIGDVDEKSKACLGYLSAYLHVKDFI